MWYDFLAIIFVVVKVQGQSPCDPKADTITWTSFTGDNSEHCFFKPNDAEQSSVIDIHTDGIHHKWRRNQGVELCKKYKSRLPQLTNFDLLEAFYHRALNQVDKEAHFPIGVIIKTKEGNHLTLLWDNGYKSVEKIDSMYGKPDWWDKTNDQGFIIEKRDVFLEVKPRLLWTIPADKINEEHWTAKKIILVCHYNANDEVEGGPAPPGPEPVEIPQPVTDESGNPVETTEEPGDTDETEAPPTGDTDRPYSKIGIMIAMVVGISAMALM